MNVYQINPERLNQFMMKKALNDVGLFVIIIIVFALIMGISTEMKVAYILLAKGAPYILPFLGVIFLFSMISSGVPGATRYEIGDNFFGRFLQHGDINAFTQHSLNRLERRHGQKQFDKIYFNETKSVKFTKSKIIIKSERFNFWNGNGKIVIPCEVAEFEDIKRQITDICRSNRNIDRQF